MSNSPGLELMKKIKLVADWKSCYKWLSVNCMVLAAAFQGAWIYIPEDLRQAMPPGIVTAITVGLLFLGVVGRLINQTKDK